MSPDLLTVPPRSPLVDTNVLFEYLLGRFSAERSLRIDVALLQYLFSRPLQDALLWYLDFAKPIRTSPHVIAEIHGLLRSRAHWDAPRLSDFWGFAQDELSQLQITEEFQQIVEMDRRDLKSFFPTDTSLLARAASMQCALVTEDRSLRGRCAERGIRFLTCGEIVAFWQERT